MNKQIEKAAEILVELHVAGSFDPSKGAILKNYSMFYSEIENNELQSSDNHSYWKRVILINGLCVLVQFQMQTWKGFSRNMNSIKRTLLSQLIIYSWNTLLGINELTHYTWNMSKKYLSRWCNTKKLRLRESKCKVSEKWKSNILKWPDSDKLISHFFSEFSPILLMF